MWEQSPRRGPFRDRFCDTITWLGSPVYHRGEKRFVITPLLFYEGTSNTTGTLRAYKESWCNIAGGESKRMSRHY